MIPGDGQTSRARVCAARGTVPRRGPVYRFSTADSRARNADEDATILATARLPRDVAGVSSSSSRLAAGGRATRRRARRDRTSRTIVFRARARPGPPPQPFVVGVPPSSVPGRVRAFLVSSETTPWRPPSARPAPPDSPLGSDLPPELSAAIEAESGATLTEFPSALVAHAVDQSRLAGNRAFASGLHREAARACTRRPSPAPPTTARSTSAAPPEPRPRRRRRRASRRRARRRHRPELAQGALRVSAARSADARRVDRAPPTRSRGLPRAAPDDSAARERATKRRRVWIVARRTFERAPPRRWRPRAATARPRVTPASRPTGRRRPSGVGVAVAANHATAARLGRARSRVASHVPSYDAS